MAYDRYDTRRGSRERWRADDRYDRERSYGDRDRFERDRDRFERDRDERGFFERAGDEIASWFGDDDAERRRRMDARDYDRGDYRSEYRRDRDFDPRSTVRSSRYDRERDFGRSWRDDDDQGFLSTSSYRGYAGEGPERGPSMWSKDSDRDRSFRHGRDDFSRTSQRDFGRSSATERSHDPHYAQWRNRQIDELDRDYDEYRRENQSRFESDFGDWRTRRQGKRQMLGQVREHMEVVGSDDEHVGKVDRVAGDRIILTKSDPEAGGVHHSLPCSMIDEIDGDRIKLDCEAEQAKRKWRDESRDRALFEREDQGEAGPMMLERSFSGTYR
ncbi:MAG TPA: DUF2171 domain-containing protein [Sphingomicrobium sp.]